jgi:type VI secretion system protein ImpC
MVAVSRFSHYLKCMVRDQIGETKEKQQLEIWLQSWLNQYIDPNPATSSSFVKARKPLAAGKVEVFADEENPGYYAARFYLRPHFQLEGMDIGMSLVSRLPAKAA